ncbi:hypothetical protein M2212_006224 [Bradyrhizobium elkanii]|uniref:hypothetical protein n=1 Tax=Bradyrhizobium elkanii TaxID=29448 RepID=UPI00216A3875|nr:hypothetical protein [Bradyrhizobium elkanii]MCS3479378.1 hypothetical protein [Bradyrhizobium elkanii]
MYRVYSIHSGHAGGKGDVIKDFYRWGIGSRGIEKPDNWYGPRGFAPTANVSIVRDSEGLVAWLSDINQLRSDGAHLWIQHGVFLGNGRKFAPEYLDIEVEGIHEYWKRLSLTSGDGVDIWSDDPELPELITSGVLYARTGRTPQADSLSQSVSISARSNEARDGSNAYLNPLILEYSVDGSIEPTRDNLELRSPESVLDIHPGPGSEDLPRLKLHAMMWQEWAGSLAARDEVMPVVPRLLLGDGCPKAGVALFSILDGLGGTFAIENVSSVGGAAWRWYSPPLVSKHRDLLWLARRCCIVLGIELVEGTTDSRRPLPRPETEYSRHVDNDRKHDVTRADLVGTDVENALMRAEVPRLMRAVALSIGIGDEIRRRAAAIASNDGFPHFKFIEETGREFLLPRSPILASLPAPPPWLDDADRLQWLDFRNKNALALLTSPLAAASWWLKLLDATVGRPSKPVPAWSAGNNAWWWSYYSGLFRRPHDYTPQWEAPSGSGILNRASLGRLVLGGGGAAVLKGQIDALLNLRILAEGRE